LQIAKNHALNEQKKRRATTSLDDVELIAKAEPIAESGVMEVMERVLTAEERRIVTLHVLWRYKHREIGKILDLPTGTVTSKYKRSIEKLQKNLKEVEV
jgi:RNA polymerase sigma-70 factor (ECF subfamily)